MKHIIKKIGKATLSFVKCERLAYQVAWLVIFTALLIVCDYLFDDKILGFTITLAIGALIASIGYGVSEKTERVVRCKYGMEYSMMQKMHERFSKPSLFVLVTSPDRPTNDAILDHLFEHEEIHDLIKEGLVLNGIQGDPKNPIKLDIWVS